MTGLVVSNQRGGVGKTTTAINYAGYLARQNQRVLLIDADSQGSINSYLGLKPTRFIANLIVNKEPLTQCVTPYGPRLDVLCSNRETAQAEAVVQNLPGLQLRRDPEAAPRGGAYARRKAHERGHPRQPRSLFRRTYFRCT